MITKADSYGPCENLHTEEDIPPATHLVEREVQGIPVSLLVCQDCADRYEAVGFTSEPLRQEEEERMPYQEEWETLYGSLPRQIDPESFNPFE